MGSTMALPLLPLWACASQGARLRDRRLRAGMTPTSLSWVFLSGLLVVTPQQQISCSNPLGVPGTLLGCRRGEHGPGWAFPPKESWRSMCEICQPILLLDKLKGRDGHPWREELRASTASSPAKTEPLSLLLGRPSASLPPSLSHLPPLTGRSQAVSQPGTLVAGELGRKVGRCIMNARRWMEDIISPPIAKEHPW